MQKPALLKINHGLFTATPAPGPTEATTEATTASTTASTTSSTASTTSSTTTSTTTTTTTTMTTTSTTTKSPTKTTRKHHHGLSVAELWAEIVASIASLTSASGVWGCENRKTEHHHDDDEEKHYQDCGFIESGGLWIVNKKEQSPTASNEETLNSQFFVLNKVIRRRRPTVFDVNMECSKRLTLFLNA